MNYCLPLAKIDQDDLPLVGGKGANLGEMVRAGFPVPPGFVVTTPAYFDFISSTGLRDKIHHLLAGMNVDNTKALDEASQLIQRAFAKTPIPAAIEEDIRSSYRELAHGKKILVAVRSSSTGEDLAGSSAAGQQSTFLNVAGADEVVRYVREAWASMFNARAIFYRHEQRMSHFTNGLAVPVQIMVDASSSGIAFSVDPVTGDKTKLIVEAIYGLGELIVQGAVTPDHFEYDKRTLELTYHQIGLQDRQMIRARTGNKIIPVSRAHALKQKADPKVLKRVAEYTKRLETHFLKPQDMEWAYDGRKLWVVQTRPVTKAVKPAATVTSINLPKLLRGAPGSPGLTSGKVIVIHSPSEISRVRPGDVLVTEMTTPDFVPAMKRAAAIVTDKGGRTAHAAIVSRELGIPAVVGTTTATAMLRTGQVVTVNGTTGLVYQGANTGTAVKLDYNPAVPAPLVTKPVTTATKLMVNLAEPELAEQVATLPVDGVGLLRAEFMIAQIGLHPSFAIKEGLTKTYITKLEEGLVKFCRAFQGRPIIYRATDFKANEYQNLKGGKEFEQAEANPMLGFRGAARYIANPDQFELELTAVKRVRNVHNLKNLQLMIPFVRSPQELAEVKKLVTAAGLHRSNSFHLYMMAEVPSNVIELAEFAAVGIDGISVGSNDLTQLLLGVDRDSAKVAAEFNELDPAVLWALERLGREGRKLGLSVGICGQAPSVYPELTSKLVDWGYSYISVSPDAVNQVRQLILAAERSLTKAK